MGFKNTVRFLAGRLAVIGIALLFSALARPAQLTPATQAAWSAHVAEAKSTLEQCAHAKSNFLPVAETRARAGRIVVSHTGEGGMIRVPNGLIHDWTGVVFVPGARIGDVTRILQDYNRYAELYTPAVTASRLLNRQRDAFRYHMQFQAKSFGVKVGLAGDFRSEYWFPDAVHGYSITEATRLVELENAGTADGREISLENAHGYVERMFSMIAYHEADGGVYLQVRAISLSRDIPSALRWFVAPFVERVSRDVLTSTLTKFRNGVQASLASVPQLSAGLP